MSSYRDPAHPSFSSWIIDGPYQGSNLEKQKQDCLQHKYVHLCEMNVLFCVEEVKKEGGEMCLYYRSLSSLNQQKTGAW